MANIRSGWLGISVYKGLLAVGKRRFSANWWHTSRNLVNKAVAGRSLGTAALCRARKSFQLRCASSTPGGDMHVQAMVEILGDSAVVTDPEDMAPYNIDWLKNHKGHSRMVLLPSTTQELSRVLAHCNQHGVKVVPQGGNTGLVGGSVPLNDEVIVNMKRMNKIVSLDESSGVMVCEAGCILEQLDEWLEERGFMMPLDLGAKGSCMIGGNVSTNAGGVHFIRHGSMHSNVLGVEAVLADGTVLNLLNVHRKDNTGFPLKHLFIGSEGCLGVITSVAIQVPHRPNSRRVCVCVCDTFEHVVELLKRSRNQLGEAMSAFEFVDHNGIQALSEISPEAVKPLKGIWPASAETKFLVLIEASSADPNSDRLMERVESLLMPLIDERLIQGVVIAADGAQEKALWNIRESVPVALAQLGRLFKYDLSLPAQQMYGMVVDTAEYIQQSICAGDMLDDEHEPISVTGFGHLGDGNLHLNVLLKRKYHSPDDAGAVKTLQIKRQLNKFIYDRCIAMGGSISAEHGIGLEKLPHMQDAHEDAVLSLMRDMKKLLDPKGILNPGKVVPPS